MGGLALNISFLTYGLSALAYLFLLGLLIQKDQYKNENIWLLLAVIISVIWSIMNCTVSLAGAYTPSLYLLFLTYLLPFANWLKAALWVIFLFSHLRIIWNSQGNQLLSKRAVGLLISLLSFGFIIEALNIGSLWGYLNLDTIGEAPLYNKLIISFVILLLIENLYRNTANENRWGIRLFCLGLGSIYAFDFLLYGDSIFYSLVDPQLYEARGAVNFIIAPLLAIAIFRKPNWSVGISLSRRAAFHMVSLVVGIIYLVAISVLGFYIQSLGGKWGTILQVSFLFGAFVGFVAIIYSGKIRSTILVWLNKYFFVYNFDYREEWLRFIQTMTASEDHYNLQERAIKAVADIMDSNGGALWFRTQPDIFSQIARWNFQHELDEDLNANDPFALFLEKTHWIVDLDECEAGKIPETDCNVPEWIRNIHDLWLVVPLVHHREMSGFIILYKPRAYMELNWETIDLLKTVSLQIASYLAEQETLKALSIASEFEAFNRKFAFVIHDIKNMASQLSLLHRNAEKHGNNPEFQKDMKLTVQNTVEKMNSLLSRINIIQEPSHSKLNEEINVYDILNKSINKFKKTGQDIIFESKEEELKAYSNEEDLDIVFMHIIQNAIDAMKINKPIHVSLLDDKKYLVINIKDEGEGMSKDFIRNELFRPFRSLKENGYGIGAYESRQLIHNMGGRLEVKSQIGIGTKVTIYLKKSGGI